MSRHEATIRGSVGAYAKKHEGDISINEMLAEFGIPREAILREPSVSSAAVKELLGLGYAKVKQGNMVLWRKAQPRGDRATERVMTKYEAASEAISHYKRLAEDWHLHGTSTLMVEAMACMHFESEEKAQEAIATMNGYLEVVDAYQGTVDIRAVVEGALAALKCALGTDEAKEGAS